MLQPKDIDWLNGYRNKTRIYAFYKRPTSESLPSSLLDSLNHQRADSRSKKNYNPAACGPKTTVTER